MSPGAIAVTAILVSGAEVGGLVAAGTWLIYTKRIMLAATPKPPGPPQPGREAKAEAPQAAAPPAGELKAVGL